VAETPCGYSSNSFLDFLPLVFTSANTLCQSSTSRTMGGALPGFRFYDDPVRSGKRSVRLGRTPGTLNRKAAAHYAKAHGDWGRDWTERETERILQEQRS
jgi:hypothetical protein